MSDSRSTPGARCVSAQAEISREMVRLYKEQFGRGPTKARTDFVNPDLVVCTLEYSLTPAEQRLVELGEHQRMRDTRLCFQHAGEKDFRAVVERVLGRRVRGFISGMDTRQDIASELFYLVPDESGPPDRDFLDSGAQDPRPLDLDSGAQDPGQVDQDTGLAS